MAANKDEEAVFLRHVRSALLNIEELARWIEPEDVVIDDTLERALAKHEFSGALLVIHDANSDDDAFKYGVSGDLYLGCFVTVLVNPSSSETTASEEVPSEILGELDARCPSLTIIDGILRDAFKLETFSGFVFYSKLGASTAPRFVEPLNAVARSYPFTAIKEISR
jgi:hypothetical protein